MGFFKDFKRDFAQAEVVALVRERIGGAANLARNTMMKIW